MPGACLLHVAGTVPTNSTTLSRRRIISSPGSCRSCPRRAAAPPKPCPWLQLRGERREGSGGGHVEAVLLALLLQRENPPCQSEQTAFPRLQPPPRRRPHHNPHRWPPSARRPSAGRQPCPAPAAAAPGTTQTRAAAGRHREGQCACHARLWCCAEHLCARVSNCRQMA